MDDRYKSVFLYFQEDGHKYEDSLGHNYKSVTTLIQDYVAPFDKKYWLHRKAKELGISEKQLEKQWQDITEEACTRGTKTHNYIEDGIKSVSMFKDAIKYLTDIDSGRCVTVADIPDFTAVPLDIPKFIEATENKYPEIYEVFKFYTDRGYTIYSEIGAYLIDYLISGTIDVLAIKEDRFVILDWKTNRDGLKFESGYYKKDKTTKPAQLTDEWVYKDERMLAPVSHLPECNGSHYSIQLSMYALMVEMILGIPCVGLALCHIASPFYKNKYGQPYRDEHNQYPIDPNGKETVTWHKIKYLRNECIAILQDRKLKLDAENKATGQTELNLEYYD